MRVALPVPTSEFDPTEAAIPWAVLRAAGVEVVFATPDGERASADDRMLSGRGLGPWRPFLRTNSVARAAYSQLAKSDEFRHPISYRELDSLHADGILFPGGHAPGMKPYLESTVLQGIAARYVLDDRPVGAICHGVIVLARSGALQGRTVTALTRSMELTAWGMTGMWLGRYYRTYPETVQAEVGRAVGSAGRFREGPFAVLRDSPDNLGRGFTVVDRNLVTARWPGDAHRFASDFLTVLKGA